ncbi:MAG TPA: cytochrome P450 [Dehalococcoidia bacterium]|nr:cytochrome P450 [Dehalococcoidia bacterium]
MSSRRVPPGPRSFSPFGNLPALQRDPLGTFLRDRERYGDVVRYRGGIWYAYLVSHPDDIKHVLQDNNQNYRKGFSYEVLKPVLGQGLLTNEGESWLRQRRLAQPAFHRARIARISGLMSESIEAMLARWDSRLDPEAPVDVLPEMIRLTLEIVSRTLLGVRLGPEADQVGQAVRELQAHVNYRATHLFSLPEKYPTPRNRRFHRWLALLDAIVFRIIDQHRAAGPGGDDLLSMLLAARDQESGEGMSDRQLRDEVMTIFLAGHETTATALTWTWYLLSQHPEAEARLHREVDTVLDGRPPVYDDLASLPYTRMILEESMRLYPPAWAVGRFAVGPDTVGGYDLPAGSQIVMSQYVTHRHPAFWERPDEFDPERFTPERSAGRPRFAYFPFGGGPRYCIGADFAMIEAQLTLAAVAQRYRLRLSPGHPVEVDPLVTLRPKHGMVMRLERRRPGRAGVSSATSGAVSATS